jgi:hypothetical protein
MSKHNQLLRTIEEAKQERERLDAMFRKQREEKERAEQPKRDAEAKFFAKQVGAAQLDGSFAHHLAQARQLFDYFVSKIEADKRRDRAKILQEMQDTRRFDSVKMLEQDYDEAIAPMTYESVFDWEREAFLQVRTGPNATYHDGDQWVPLPDRLANTWMWGKYSDNGVILNLPNWERLAKAFRKQPLRHVIRWGYFKGWTLKSVCGRGRWIWFDATLAEIVLEKPPAAV